MAKPRINKPAAPVRPSCGHCGALVKKGETACVACQRSALLRAQQGGLWDVSEALKAQEMSSEEALQEQEKKRKFGMLVVCAMWGVIGLGLLMAHIGAENYSGLCAALAFVPGIYLTARQKSRARANGWAGLAVSALMGALACVYCFLT